MPERLKNIDAFLLDMDGTFYLGEELLPGARLFLEILGRMNKSFLFLTNNSSASPQSYASKLQRMGVGVSSDRIFTSGEACAGLLKNQGFSRVFLMGTKDLETVFSSEGLSLCNDSPQAVVLGFDLGLTYQKVKDACNFIRMGLPWFATHPDINCPTPQGPIPDAGAMMAMIQASTGVAPQAVAGKPSCLFMEAAAARLGVSPGRCAMVGDRLYTDVAAARAAGMLSVLVLSGESLMEDIQSSPHKPDLVAQDLLELGSWLY